MKLSGSQEENILTLLCWNEKYSAQAFLDLTPDLFSTRPLRRLAERAFAYIETYSAPPRHHLRDLCEEDIRKADGQMMGLTLDAMERLSGEMNPEFVIDTLDRFITKRKLIMSLERASDKVEGQDDIEGAMAELHGQVPLPKGEPGIWLHDAQRMTGFMDRRDEDYFSMGIRALDDRGISPARQTLTVLVAPPKKGKSWFLVNIGKVNMIHGHRVLHVTLENSQDLTAQRYIMNLFAMTKKEAGTVRVPMFDHSKAGHFAIRYDTQNPDALTPASRQKVMKRLAKYKQRSRLMIKGFPTSMLTVPMLTAYLDSLKQTDGFEPDLLIVDYPDLMNIDSANLRIDTGRLFKDLRGVCVARNLAGVVVTQGGRDAERARLVTGTMVAEDFSKIMTADTVLTYSQTGDEKQAGLARIFVAAARGDADKYIVLITQSYATGQFCLDSTFMTHYVEKEAERVTGDGPDIKGTDNA